MFKQSVIFAVLLVCVILATGCETTKGLATGFTGLATGVGGTMVSTAEGVGKDSVNLWKFIKASDNWIKENLW